MKKVKYVATYGREFGPKKEFLFHKKAISEVAEIMRYFPPSLVKRWLQFAKWRVVHSTPK